MGIKFVFGLEDIIMETTIIKEGSVGLVKDGRRFEVIKFYGFQISEEGNILDGLVGVLLDDKFVQINLSSLAKNIDYEERHAI